MCSIGLLVNRLAANVLILVSRGKLGRQLSSLIVLHCSVAMLKPIIHLHCALFKPVLSIIIIATLL